MEMMPLSCSLCACKNGTGASTELSVARTRSVVGVPAMSGRHCHAFAALVVVWHGSRGLHSGAFSTACASTVLGFLHLLWLMPAMSAGC